jgi:hypothetical protein
MGQQKPPILDYRDSSEEPSLIGRTTKRLDLSRLDSSAAKISMGCSAMALIDLLILRSLDQEFDVFWVLIR